MVGIKQFKIGDQFDIDVYSQICCDQCWEVISNDIDCPVCKTENSDTDKNWDLNEDNETELTCEKCNTTFEKISKGSWYTDCKVKIKSLQP